MIANLSQVLDRRYKANHSSSSEDEHEGNGSISDSWENTSLSSQPNKKEGTSTSGSGHGSGDGANSRSTSPSHSERKTEESPVPPKPANLQTKPEAPLVNKESDVSSVNSKVQNLSVKDRCGVFGEMATKFERELLVR